MNILRKISPDTMMGPDRVRPVQQEWWYRVVGRASGFEVGTTQFGEFTELTGEFIATRFDGGEPAQSGRCFLPCGMAELLADRLRAAAEANAGNMGAVEFCFDIGAMPANKRVNATGKDENEHKYTYNIRDAMDNGRNSPLLTKLLNAPLPSGVKSLPAGAAGPSGGSNPLLEGAAPSPARREDSTVKLADAVSILPPGAAVLTPMDPGYVEGQVTPIAAVPAPTAGASQG